MIVRCVLRDPRSTLLSVDQRADLLRTFPSGPADVRLTVGVRYTVYAVRGRPTFPWLYLSDDAYTYYPTPFPGFMFEFVDGGFPSQWESKPRPLDSLTDGEWLAPDAWRLGGDAFYERLLNRDSNAEQAFASAKAIMDANAV